jgi:predicted permease
VASTTASPPKEADAVGGWRWQFKVIVLENPPVVATIIGIAVAMLPPVQMLLFGKSAPLQFVTNAFAVVGKATPCVTNIVMAASLGLQLKKCKRWADVLGGESMGISRRTLLTLVFAKMVIVPAVTFCSVWFLQDSLPEDRWYRLLLFMECATPTANNVVVLANILGDQDAAQLLALTTISQFAIFLPVSTLITAVGLGMTDHLV